MKCFHYRSLKLSVLKQRFCLLQTLFSISKGWHFFLNCCSSTLTLNTFLELKLLLFMAPILVKFRVLFK